MEIILRAAALYMFLWMVTRATGKRELAQMSPFELILLVTMGDLIQQGATQDDRSLTGAFLAVSTMTVMIVFFSWFTHRVRRAADVFDGIPSIVVRDGEPIHEALKLERLSVEDVAVEARAQGIRSLHDVEVGILETDGGFSFLLRDGVPDNRQQRGKHGMAAS